MMEQSTVERVVFVAVMIAAPLGWFLGTPIRPPAPAEVPSARASAAPRPPVRNALYARRLLDPAVVGQLTPDLVEERVVPPGAALPPTAVKRLQDVYGKVLAVAIMPGELIDANNFRTGSRNDLATATGGAAWEIDHSGEYDPPNAPPPPPRQHQVFSPGVKVRRGPSTP